MLRLFQRHAARARDNGLSRQLIEDERLEGDSVVLGGRRLANFGLCSYLGLGDDERLKEAAKQAIDRYGTSYSSSVAYTALPLYRELRERLEAIMGSKVVIAPTTTLAHFSALPVLIRPRDLVLVDTLAHASLQTATQNLQATGITVRTIPHNDLGALDQGAAEWEEGRVWMLADGVYSMHGDLAPAEAYADLLERHPRLHLYIDDAHGFGWEGLHGRGAYLHRVGWHDRLVVAVGLAKAFGTMGGVVALRDPELADLIDLTGPPLTFGGPIPPPILGASVAAADIHLSEELPRRQAEVGERISLVNRLAREMGLPLTSLAPTPIWYLAVGDYDDMTRLFLAMREAGFYLNGAAFPVVPYGQAGLRFTVTWHNPPERIEAMLTALHRLWLETVGGTEIVVDLTAEIPMVSEPAD